jgi:2-keto-4-pentenoate hydratase/2-oxohepta-3-ene-1,7-dioic acid hydratase in catechol pathway
MLAPDLVGEWERRFGRSGPQKIVCVGLNYRDHAEEQGVEPPAAPLLFAKLPNALSAPGDPIPIPPESGHVDAEAELAVVIGRRARRIPAGRALEVVAAYTAANDVSAHDLQFSDGQWLRSKSFDGFCPLGPRLVDARELGAADDLRIVQRVNGLTLQESRTSQLIFGVREVVAHVSDAMTLEPGDLILTGTPAGVGIFREPPVALRPGDEVEVEVEGIGVLQNPVAAEPRG